MARPVPLTLDDVDAARRGLAEAGVHPSVRLVRQRLGRGSLTTITAHLRSLAAARAGTDVGASVPDPILETLKGAADTVWAELAEAAEARIAEVVAASDARMSAALAERDEACAAAADAAERTGTLSAHLARRDAALDALRHAHETLTAEHAALVLHAATLARDHAGLADRLADRDGEIGRTRGELERARQALDDRAEALGRAIAERERTAAASDAASARHATAQDQALAEAQRLAEQLDTARASAMEAATTTARLETWLEAGSSRESSLQARLASLETERDDARTAVGHSDAAAAAARHELSLTRRALERWQRHSLDLRAYAARLHAGLHAAGLARPSDEPLPALDADDVPPGAGATVTTPARRR